MAVVIVTTDVSHVTLPADFFITSDNDSTLHVNSRSPFTIHYAIWPFVGLISLIVTVWVLVYVSTVVSHRHNPKGDKRNFASFYVTSDSTIGGGYEASNVVSPVDV